VTTMAVPLPYDAAPVSGQSPGRSHARVLIVDDEPRIRLALRCCLEALGYEVEEASDGREALAAIVHFTPDLVLLDLAMPHLDGLSTARLLATVYAPVRPKVVVLTADSSTCMAEAARGYGASAFVEKPILPDALRDVVARVLAEPLRALPEAGELATALSAGPSARSAPGRGRSAAPHT
jgi:CheY-like chemotaxis protein